MKNDAYDCFFCRDEPVPCQKCDRGKRLIAEFSTVGPLPDVLRDFLKRHGIPVPKEADERVG